jgi:WD40 repeat protein
MIASALQGADIEEWAVRVLETSTGRVLARLVHDAKVQDVAFSPDGSRVASGSTDGLARVWDVGSGQELAHVAHSGPVRRVVFSWDGREVASGGDDADLAVWNAASGQIATRIAGEGWLVPITFTPDGSKLLSLDAEGVRMWDITSGEPVPWPAQEDTTAALDALLGKGQFVVVAPADEPWAALAHFPVDKTRAVDVWVAQSDREGLVEVLNGTTDDVVARMQHDCGRQAWGAGEEMEWIEACGVYARVFSPDGRWLASGSQDQTVRVWTWWPADLVAEACARLPRNLTRNEWEMYIPGQPYRRTCPGLPEPLVIPTSTPQFHTPAPATVTPIRD